MVQLRLTGWQGQRRRRGEGSGQRESHVPNLGLGGDGAHVLEQLMGRLGGAAQEDKGR